MNYSRQICALDCLIDCLYLFCFFLFLEGDYCNTGGETSEEAAERERTEAGLPADETETDGKRSGRWKTETGPEKICAILEAASTAENARLADDLALKKRALDIEERKLSLQERQLDLDAARLEIDKANSAANNNQQSRLLEAFLAKVGAL